MTSEAANVLLNRDQMDSYHRNGYLLYREPLFSSGQLDELETIFDEHRGSAPGSPCGRVQHAALRGRASHGILVSSFRTGSRDLHPWTKSPVVVEPLHL